MRRQKDVCLLHRHIFKPYDSIPSLIRYASSKSREPYILPRLVIDLDAKDSQFVREATKEDYAVEPKPPRRKRYDNTVREKERSPQGAHAFQNNNITAPDLLAYALLGSPYATPTADNLALRKEFRRFKIHPLDNARTKVNRLTSNFTVDASKVSEGSGFPEQEAQILEQIRGCMSFNDLKRIITKLSSTTEGCTFLAKEGAAIVIGIRNCRRSNSHYDPRSRKTSAAMVLTLLNNLFLNMQSKGVDYGKDLCNAALYYASKIYCLQSIRRYLDISHSKSYSADKLTPYAISNLVTRQPRSFTAPGNKPMNLEEQRKTTLHLLTGWELDGLPQHGEGRKPCFASLMQDNTPATVKRTGYSHYIGSLGYIGASKALWHEWVNTPEGAFIVEHKEQHLNLEPPTANDREEKAELFVIAFLMAKDPDRASHVLKTLFEHEHRSWNGLSHYSCNRIFWYYKSNNLLPTERLRDRVNVRFSSDQTETVLGLIDDLLVPDWIESKQSATIPDGSAQYHIDWVEQDGVERIAIKKDLDGDIVYLKPLS